MTLQRSTLLLLVAFLLVVLYALWAQQDYADQLHQASLHFKAELRKLRDENHAQTAVLDAKLQAALQGSTLALQLARNLSSMAIDKSAAAIGQRLEAAAQAKPGIDHSLYSSVRCTPDENPLHHICTFHNLYFHPGGQFVYYQNTLDSTPIPQVVLSQRLIGTTVHDRFTPTVVHDPPKFYKTIAEPMALMCGTGNDNHAHNFQEMEGPMFWLISIAQHAIDLDPQNLWVYFHTCNSFPVDLYGQNSQQPKLFLARGHEETFRPLYTAKPIVTAVNLATTLGSDHVRVLSVTMGMWATSTISTMAPFRPERQMQQNGVLWTDFLLRKMGLPSKFEEPSNSNSIMVLQRTHTRKIVNADALIARLRSEFPNERVHGPETFGGMSLAQQMNVSRHAKVIISAHGAQLSNALFAPPGATIIELLNNGCEREVGGIPNKYPLAFKSIIAEYSYITHSTAHDHEGCSNAQFEGEVRADIEAIVQKVRDAVDRFPTLARDGVQLARQLKAEFLNSPSLSGE